MPALDRAKVDFLDFADARRANGTHMKGLANERLHQKSFNVTWVPAQ